VLGAGGIETATEQALAFADTFDTDVAGAISAAGQLIETGLANTSEDAFDLLTTGFQQMPADLREELIEASNEYGRFFDQLGLSGNEAFGLLTRAADGGMFAIDKTGDALKELTIRGTDMSTASVEAFTAAGLSADDMAARFLEGGDSAAGALSDLVDGLLDIEDPVKQANAAIGLFGTPIEDLGTDQIPVFLQSLQDLEGGMGDVAGSADDMADTISGTNAVKIEAFRRKVLGGLADFTARHVIPAFERFAAWGERNWPAISAVATSAFDKIKEKLTPVIDGLVKAFSKVKEWVITNWPEIEKIIGKVAKQIGKAVGIMGGAIRTAFEWIIKNKPVLIGVLTAITVAWLIYAGAALAAAVASILALGPVLLFAIAVGAVVLAMLLLKPHMERFINWAMPGIKKGFDIAKTAVDIFKAAFGAVWEIMKSVAGWLEKGAKKAWEGFKTDLERVKNFLDGPFSGAWKGIKKIIQFVIDTIEVLITTIGKIPSPKSVLGGFLGAVIETGSNLLPGGPKHSGGVFRTQKKGGQGFALLQDGETVTPAGRAALSAGGASGGGGGTQVIQLVVSGRVLAEVVAEANLNSGGQFR